MALGTHNIAVRLGELKLWWTGTAYFGEDFTVVCFVLFLVSNVGVQECVNVCSAYGLILLARYSSFMFCLFSTYSTMGHLFQNWCFCNNTWSLRYLRNCPFFGWRMYKVVPTLQLFPAKSGRKDKMMHPSKQCKPRATSTAAKRCKLLFHNLTLHFPVYSCIFLSFA